ncbi:MAG: hypothetical protein WCL49_07670 [bacterium]
MVLLVAALSIRIAAPDCFHLPGNDIPEHIAYSMSLDFPVQDRSFFRTTIDRLLSFNHGYTQAAGMYLLYKSAFDWLSAPINPHTLALVHSLVGIASLAAFFAFIRRQTSFHAAIIMTTCLALMPVHVGISTTNSGYQLFKLTGIFLTLWRLDIYQRTTGHRTALLYALSLTFGIGASVDFFFTLSLNILYAIWSRTPGNPCVERNRFLPLIIIGAVIPVAAIFAWHAYTVALGFPRGILSRLSSVTQFSHGTFFDPLGVLRNLSMLVGPITLLAPIAIATPRVWRQGAWAKVAMIQWVWEFAILSFSGRGAWTSHILNLAAPSLILVWLFLRPLRYGVVLFVTGGILSAILSLMIIFRVGPTDVRTTYGSRSYQETGIEALGFLVRSGKLPCPSYENSTKYALAVDFEGAWLFLGADTLGFGELKHKQEQEHQPANLIFVQRPGLHSEFNEWITSRVSAMRPDLEILDGSNVLMRVFTAAPGPNTRTKQSRNLKAKFYSTYNTMHDYNFLFIP